MSDKNSDTPQVQDKRSVGQAEGASEAEKAAGEQAYTEASNGCSKKEPRPLPPLDFSTFILSLSTSVLLHLGELPDPDTQSTESNLSMARQSLDLLGMLQDKTRGNLTDDESKLLENLLYDLRMKYVAQCRGH